MNTKAKHPEYLGEATVIDRAEFARLIRKAGHLRVTLFIEDRRTVAKCQDSLASFNVPAKQAVEKLSLFDFDAFEWNVKADGTPGIWHYAASMRLQLQRRLEKLLKRQEDHTAVIARVEALLAASLPCEEWRLENAAARRRTRDAERIEIESLQADLAPRVATTVAA